MGDDSRMEDWWRGFGTGTDCVEKHFESRCDNHGSEIAKLRRTGDTDESRYVVYLLLRVARLRQRRKLFFDHDKPRSGLWPWSINTNQIRGLSAFGTTHNSRVSAVAGGDKEYKPIGIHNTLSGVHPTPREVTRKYIQDHTHSKIGPDGTPERCFFNFNLGILGRGFWYLGRASGYV